MEEARGLLRSCSGDVDIILAREGGPQPGPAHAQTAAPVERRRRRRLPTIERPKSAPIYNGLVDFRYNVMPFMMISDISLYVLTCTIYKA